MMLIFISLGIGIILGRFLRDWKNLTKRLDPILNILIFLLLFIIGLSIGSNKNVTANIISVGKASTLLAVASTLGSILTTYGLLKFIYFKNRSK